MLPDIHTWIFLLGQFFQAGGWVLYVILFVTFILFSLILERLLFRFFSYPSLKKKTMHDVFSQSNDYQRVSLFCDLDLALKHHFALLKTLVMICPLVGLLGTVTGMIKVFDSLALYGTGNPRLMAAGVASATIPTMTGMAVAVCGIIFVNRLQQWSENERRRLKTSLYSGGSV